MALWAKAHIGVDAQTAVIIRQLVAVSLNMDYCFSKSPNKDSLENIMPATKPAQSNADRMGLVALKLFFRLAEAWRLSEDQQLSIAGSPARATLYNWKQKVNSDQTVRLSKDTLERLSLLAGIRKGVELLYPKNQWNQYPHRANVMFGGQSMVERMSAGRLIDLWDVRRYLDAERGSHFG